MKIWHIDGYKIIFEKDGVLPPPISKGIDWADNLDDAIKIVEKYHKEEVKRLEKCLKEEKTRTYELFEL